MDGPELGIELHLGLLRRPHDDDAPPTRSLDPDAVRRLYGLGPEVATSHVFRDRVRIPLARRPVAPAARGRKPDAVAGAEVQALDFRAHGETLLFARGTDNAHT